MSNLKSRLAAAREFDPAFVIAAYGGLSFESTLRKLVIYESGARLQHWRDTALFDHLCAVVIAAEEFLPVVERNTVLYNNVANALKALTAFLGER